MRVPQLKPLFFVGAVLGMCIAVLVCTGISMLLSKLPRTDNTAIMSIELSSKANPVKLSDSNLSIKLREIAQIASPIAQKTELLSIFDGLDHGRLIDLIDQSVAILTGKRLHVALEIMFANLTQENPKLALEKIWTMESMHRSALVAVVFREWSLSDIDGALRSANELTGLYEDIAVRSIFSSGRNLTDSQLLEIAQKYGNESIADLEISESKARSLMDRPFEAFKHALSDSVEDETQFGLLTEIASVWVQQDGRDAFVPIFQALDEAYQDNHYGLHWQLVEKTVEFDPSAAWQALLSLPAEIQEQYCRAVLDAWVKVDPIQAVQAVSQLADRSSHNYVRNSSISEWARVAPRDLLDYVPFLAQEQRTAAVRSAIRQLARYESIDTALEQLNRMKAQGEDTRDAIAELVRIWSFDDTKAALSWLFKNADLNVYPHSSVASEIVGRMALDSPAQAMEIAISSPFQESNPWYALEASVVRALASNGRFDEAVELMEKVREPVRALAIGAVGRSLVVFGQPNDAVRLAEELSEEEREDYFVAIAGDWYYANPGHLVDSLARLPSKNAQAAVAQFVLRRNQFDKTLTSEQIEQVEKYIVNTEEGD